MKLLNKEQLEKLTTSRLLAYKNKLMMVPETSNWDEPTAQISKESPKWQKTYLDLKEVLKNREHMEPDK